MKKILQYALCVLMSSGFIEANALDPNTEAEKTIAEPVVQQRVVSIRKPMKEDAGKSSKSKCVKMGWGSSDSDDEDELCSVFAGMSLKRGSRELSLQDGVSKFKKTKIDSSPVECSCNASLVRSVRERFMSNVGKLIVSLPHVMSAYSVIAPRAGDLDSLSEIANSEWMNTMCNFLVGVRGLSSEEIKQELIPFLNSEEHPEYNVLVDMVRAVLSLRHRGLVQGVGTDGEENVRDWSTYGLIGKILNSTMDTDTIKACFNTSELSWSNRFKFENAEVYCKQLQSVNELLKSGLITNLSMLIPYRLSKEFFRTLRLCSEVREVGFTGLEFDIAEDAIRCLNNLGEVVGLDLCGAVLKDVSAFFTFIESHHVSRLHFRNVDFMNSCDFDEFRAQLRRSVVKIFVVEVIEKYSISVFQSLPFLPAGLEVLDMSLGVAYKNTPSCLRVILQFCPVIKSIVFRSPFVLDKDELAALSCAASRHPSLMHLSINGEVIFLRK